MNLMVRCGKATYTYPARPMCGIDSMWVRSSTASRGDGFEPGAGGTTWRAPLSLERKQWSQTAETLLTGWHGTQDPELGIPNRNQALALKTPSMGSTSAMAMLQQSPYGQAKRDCILFGLGGGRCVLS